MPHSSDSSDSSFSRSPPPGKQDSSDDVRKVQRREKNRIAAQKSRQRQTQKADTLHLSLAKSYLPLKILLEHLLEAPFWLPALSTVNQHGSPPHVHCIAPQ
ncbi:basic leucine zipper transcriptional factor ATF-like isoform X2 [Bubalus bubalis]|uniref:basic leucine zipper transcriptional factor ATF-like isoform X2 n=1 Tax=Bubalus bubalis TaxID=89462 RepID=UPI001D106E26|nr:basic leucine zipper transcriptional factor ATF-like isoform X2 [Bubalus bubalis]